MVKSFNNNASGMAFIKKIEILTLFVNALFLKYLVSVFLCILPPTPNFIER